MQGKCQEMWRRERRASGKKETMGAMASPDKRGGQVGWGLKWDSNKNPTWDSKKIFEKNSKKVPNKVEMTDQTE